MTRLDGKVALVTGAAHGQGRSHAVRLAEEGADVIALDICDQIGTVHYPIATTGDLDETSRQVANTRRRILARHADVRDSAQLKAVVDEGLSEFGHIDVVCANAGINSNAPATDKSDEMWNDMIAVNLTGVFRTVRAVLPSMIAAGQGGSIILTGSTASLVGFANHVHYTAAKHGIVGLMRALVNEVSRYNIRVNLVLPGAVNTTMIQNEVLYRLFNADNPTKEAIAEIFRSQHPMPVEWLEPVDISDAVVWLASHEARYVTGVSLPLDAGKTSKSR